MAIANDPAAVILAADPAANLEALRLKAKSDPKGAVKETARQFEALLMNVMLKSMRETVAQDGLFDSDQTRLYTSMLDQHLAQAMSRRGIGLAEVLERQLSSVSRAAGSPADKAIASPTGLQKAPPGAMSDPVATPMRKHDDPSSAFIGRHLSDAEAASRASGVPARFMLGQAALETGWGQAEIRHPDGRSSHNLFGIKAGAGWTGKTVDVATTEYANGIAQKKIQSFRAYDSYGDAFRDYAALLTTNPRYADVLKNTGDARAFARGLQDAGYATDPRYADKLAGVIEGRSLRPAKPA